MQCLEVTEAGTLEYIDPMYSSRFIATRYLDRVYNKRVKRGPGKGRQKKVGIYKCHKAPNPMYCWR